MKKQYIQPSMKAIMIESSEMICGSGSDTQNLRMGGNPNDDGDSPTSSNQGGFTGIFGD